MLSNMVTSYQSQVFTQPCPTWGRSSSNLITAPLDTRRSAALDWIIVLEDALSDLKCILEERAGL